MANFQYKTPSLLASFDILMIVLALLLIIGIGSAHSGNELDPYEDSGKKSKKCESPNPPHVLPVYKQDVMLLQFAQNIEHSEADFFLWGALGYGLDKVDPKLALGGPPPIGARKANLDPFTQSIIMEFGYEEVGHLRILKKTVGGIPRPLLDLSPAIFAKVVDNAFGYQLQPPFDPYRDSLSFMLASYILPYVGLNGYVGANPLIQGYKTKRLLAGLLGVEAGQDAIIRMYLYERSIQTAHPYNFTVGEFTNRISILRNKLGMCGNKDEGVVVPPALGAEGRISTNVLSSNRDEISYPRTPAEILRIVYGTGNEHVPGGFYPKGGNGVIARGYLKKPMV